MIAIRCSWILGINIYTNIDARYDKYYLFHLYHSLFYYGCKKARNTNPHPVRPRF